MKKTGVTFRPLVESPKENLDKLMGFLAPRPGELTDNLRLDLSLAEASVKNHPKVRQFVPYSSERDSLGRLKFLSSRRSTQPETVMTRAPSLPRLQQSIYTNLKEEGIVEPVDLKNTHRFKVVDGFERQINIIIRNKEFMNFLKEEKSKPR